MRIKWLKNKAYVFICMLFLGLLLPLTAQAKTAVLVHGFLGDDMTWRETGFSKALEFSGWKDGGSYNFAPWGVMIPQGINWPGNVFFTVNLPSEANLQTQENILAQYLEHLYAQRKEPITLIGHSAGGVVARLYAIDPRRKAKVNGLITIASPHLGTPTAKIAAITGNSPLGIVASMAGEDALRDGRGLFSDLKEEKPYNFLYWMNHQPHPAITYISIVRNNKFIKNRGKFDYVVPPFSQDMNNVWALRGRSQVISTKGNHFLSGADGMLVANLLRQIK